MCYSAEGEILVSGRYFAWGFWVDFFFKFTECNFTFHLFIFLLSGFEGFGGGCNERLDRQLSASRQLGSEKDAFHIVISSAFQQSQSS